jgi:hypothetical protein
MPATHEGSERGQFQWIIAQTDFRRTPFYIFTFQFFPARLATAAAQLWNKPRQAFGDFGMLGRQIGILARVTLQIE